MCGGALEYAYYIVLISPSITCVNDLLRVCSQFATEFDVKIPPKVKCYLLVITNMMDTVYNNGWPC